MRAYYVILFVELVHRAVDRQITGDMHRFQRDRTYCPPIINNWIKNIVAFILPAINVFAPVETVATSC